MESVRGADPSLNSTSHTPWGPVVFTIEKNLDIREPVQVQTRVLFCSRINCISAKWWLDNALKYTFICPCVPIWLCRLPLSMLRTCVLGPTVVSSFLWPGGLQPTRLLCPGTSPGKDTGVGCHFLLQGNFLTQGSNWCLWRFLHWPVDSLPLSHLGNPYAT